MAQGADLEAAHRRLAWVAGQLSLTIARRRLRKSELAQWVTELRRVADMLERDDGAEA